MAYATVEDVRFYIPDLKDSDLDNESSIERQAIESWLEEDSDFIDSRIGKSVNLTNITLSGLEILKQINSLLTLDKYDKSLPNFNSRTKDEQSKLRKPREEAIRMIEDIERRKIRISDSFKNDLSSFNVNTGLSNFGIPEFPKDRVL